MKKKKKKKILKITGKFFLVLILLIIALILFIRSPWGQNIIVDKVTHYVSDKTNTTVEIEKLFVTFQGNILLNGLYFEDKKGDTLLYSKSLEAEIPFIPIITGNPISIDDVEWSELTAHIYRKDSISGFNYQFLIDAFVTDTTSTEETESGEPTKIAVGSVNLKKFKIHYADEVSGMQAKLDLGDLTIKGEKIDLENMIFHLSEINLSDTDLSYEQLKAITDEDTTSTDVMPQLIVDHFELNNVKTTYNAPPQGIKALADIKLFELNEASASLQKQEISIEKIGLQNSIIDVEMDTTQLQESAEKPAPITEQEAFEWPDWEVQIAEIAIEDNTISYHQKGNAAKKGKFNPDALALTDFTFLAEDILLSKDTKANIHLNKLQFEEASGFKLKNLNLAVALENQKLNVSGLNVDTQNSSLEGNLELNYTTIQQLINQPEKVNFYADLNSFQLDAKEAYLFSPDLKQNEPFEKLAQQKISGVLNLKGSLDKTDIKQLDLNWGKQTKIKVKGSVSNPTDVEKLRLNISGFSASTQREDIVKFVNPDSLGVKIPQDIVIKGDFAGSLDDFTTNAVLDITNGQIKMQGTLNTQEQIAFNSTLEVIALDLGELLDDPALDKVTFTIETKGKGNNLNTLDAHLSSDFSKLAYKDYDFSPLELNGDIKNGTGDINLKFKDDNLDLEMHSEVKLDSVSPEIKAQIDLKGADLYALGISEKKIRSKVKLKADFKGHAEDFTLDTDLLGGTIVYDDKSYYLGDVSLDADIKKNSTKASITSQFLNSTFNSNANPEQITKALKQHTKHYFTKDSNLTQVDEAHEPVRLEMDLKFHEIPIISEVLLDGLERMDTLRAKINFNQAKHNLEGHVYLPHLTYGENLIDKLVIDFNSDGQKANFTAGFASIEAGPAEIPKTEISANFKTDQFNLNFESFREEKKLYAIHSVLAGEDEKRSFKILPEELILNNENWTIDPDNKVSFGEKQIDFSNFTLSHGSEQVTISNKETQDWGMAFNNFNLSSLLAYLNPDDYLMDGKVDGEVVFVDPFEKFGLTADLNINDFTVLQSDLGVLSLHAKSQNENGYLVDAGIKGDDIDLDFDGNFKAAEETPSFDIDLKINKITMESIQRFVPDEIKDAKGQLEGEMKLKGTGQDPEFDGFVAFNEASFNVSRLDANFTLAEERINIDNQGVYFNKFDIKDADGNDFTIDGNIITENITKPEFDLKLKAKDFIALDSSEEDNDLYYGKVVFDVGAKISGDLQFPVVEVDLTIKEETDVTYVIPETELSIEKRDGVVVFVNKENPDDILTKQDDKKLTAKITGIDLAAKLKIEPKATFNVIVDKRTDDNLKVFGEGDLIFTIARNGRTNLTGKYEINGGHYQMNLYGLVKREFDLDPSSSVTWQGDPMDASLDVRAIYNIKTSASSLMASQTTGASAEVKNRYKQRLPFFVYLDVDGELTRPKLNFDLGMPEDERGAIGGSVYSRIRQLNQQEDQLNKQVFSLLVLNKFYPESGSDGSGGGIATMARDNLNDALSDQLNTFSDKLTKNTGIDLNFGVNSYTDYQGESAQDRTDLAISAKKKLFNDRVVVEAGSEVNVQGDKRPGEENPVIGNVSIQYLLTKNGRWRLKGFRKSEYENVIDGQVFISGIALIFTREFNKFKELWDGSSELEKEKSEQEGDKKEEEEKKTNSKATKNEESNE